jgi:hypothetical protein
LIVNYTHFLLLQEKYMSEPYSEELADSEAARQLLDFGEDYRNYLDSQSDCASSLSAHYIPSPVWRRRPAVSYFLLLVVMMWRSCLL